MEGEKVLDLQKSATLQEESTTGQSDHGLEEDGENSSQDQLCKVFS